MYATKTVCIVLLLYIRVSVVYYGMSKIEHFKYRFPNSNCLSNHVFDRLWNTQPSQLIYSVWRTATGVTDNQIGSMSTVRIIEPNNNGYRHWILHRHRKIAPSTFSITFLLDMFRMYGILLTSIYHFVFGFSLAEGNSLEKVRRGRASFLRSFSLGKNLVFGYLSRTNSRNTLSFKIYTKWVINLSSANGGERVWRVTRVNKYKFRVGFRLQSRKLEWRRGEKKNFRKRQAYYVRFFIFFGAGNWVQWLVYLTTCR